MASQSTESSQGSTPVAQSATTKPTPKGTSGRSRPRASLACMNCRQRKIKCNKSSPSPTVVCASCRSLRIPCVVSRDGDRRKTGSREQVAMLQDRLMLLESLVKSQKSGAPDEGLRQSTAASTAGLSELATRDEGIGGPAEDGHFSRSSSAFESRVASAMSGAHADLSPRVEKSFVAQPRTGIRQPSFGLAVDDGFGVPAYEQSAPLGGAVGNDLGGLTPLSEETPAGLKVDNDRGQSRFYGPTCQLYIQYRDDAANGDGSWPDDIKPTEVRLDSAPLRSLLFQTFWKTQPLSQAVIEQERFQNGRSRALRSQWYSSFLENCLLACATRTSTSASVRALGSRYASSAKAEISAELENPNVASLQGFLLLSDFEATRGKDRLGYMYCSMASRLAFDLGLHQNCGDLIARGQLSAKEAHSRYVLFICTFVYDTLWTLYLGRPSAIPVDFLRAASQCAAKHGWAVHPTLDAWVGLSTDIADATQLLNGAFPMDENSIDQLAELDSKINERAAELPPWLALREDEIAELDANVYGLHVQYCGIRIVLHKLQSQATVQLAPSPRSIHHSNFIEKSRTIMYDNAIRIARLVSSYKQIFGIENVITVMLDNVYVAAAVLVSHILRQERRQQTSPERTNVSTERDLKWLQSLADMLYKAQKHYPVTARMRSTLSNLVRNTTLAGTFGTWTQGTRTPRPGQASQSGASPSATASISGIDAETALFAPELGGPYDLMLTENPFAQPDQHAFQDMDVQNMMSWVLTE